MGLFGVGLCDAPGSTHLPTAVHKVRKHPPARHRVEMRVTRDRLILESPVEPILDPTPPAQPVGIACRGRESNTAVVEFVAPEPRLAHGIFGCARPHNVTKHPPGRHPRLASKDPGEVVDTLPIHASKPGGEHHPVGEVDEPPTLGVDGRAVPRDLTDPSRILVFASSSAPKSSG